MLLVVVERKALLLPAPRCCLPLLGHASKLSLQGTLHDTQLTGKLLLGLRQHRVVGWQCEQRLVGGCGRGC